MHTRKRTIFPASKSLCLALVTGFGGFGTFGQTVFAENALPLSYEADGKCFCTNAVQTHTAANKIIPTPIGGQTVAQICLKLGEGPGLKLINDKYNYSAFADAQCGNSPALSNQVAAACDAADSKLTCDAPGAKWDLAAAYNKPLSTESGLTNQTASNQAVYTKPETRPKKPSSTVAESNPITQPETTTTVTAATAESTVDKATSDSDQTQYTSRYIKPPVSTGEAENTPTAAAAIASAPLPEAKVVQAPAKIKKVKRSPKPADPDNIIGSAIQPTGEYFSSTVVEVVEAPPVTPAPSTTPALEPTIASETVTEAASTIEIPNTTTQTPAFPTARRAPAIPRGRLNYSYIEAAPVSYDFGGAGLQLEGSTATRQGLAFFGRTGIAGEYSEFLLGMGIITSPFRSHTTDVVFNAGVEYGTFDLEVTNLDDTGGYLATYLRSRIASGVELHGGLSYSSFFDGDAAAFAAGFYQFAPRLNATAKFKLGDNDQVSFGIRYFY